MAGQPPRSDETSQRRHVTAAIVSVGNELLFGETVDTNAAWLGRTLTEWGLTVVGGFTARDRTEEVKAALGAATGIAEVVIVTGGLGPTIDDITKQAVAEYFSVGLVVDRAVRDALRLRFEAAGYDDVPRRSEAQAEVLEGSVTLPNELGTAPGMLVERAGASVVLVPGVPPEMRAIVSGPLRAHWEERGVIGPPTIHFVVHTTGIPESRLAGLVDGAWQTLPERVRERVGLAFLPDELGVDLRVTWVGMDRELPESEFARAREVLEDAVAPWRFFAESGDLAEAVSSELRRAGLTMATAESCTGGLVAKRMTDAAGASDVFLGGVVAYDNAVKMRQLGVSSADLERHGAVSEPVALQMARGVAERLGADTAVSLTGVAGPGGGSDQKPVGTVWIAIVHEGKVEAVRTQFAGDRASVRRRSAQAALAHLYRRLRAVRPGA